MNDYIKEIRALVGQRSILLPGALILIFDEECKLLLHRRDDGLWDLPGGYMEIGETIEETARREIREETRLEIGKLNLIDILSGRDFYYECPNGDSVFPVLAVYVTDDTSGDLQPDGSEVTELCFFGIDELPNMPWQLTDRIPAWIKRITRD